MIRTLRYLLLFAFIGLSASVFAQGEVAGTVLDEKKVPIIGAIVQVIQGGIAKGGAATDIDGNYVIKPLDPGTYSVVVNYVNYAKITVDGVQVNRGRVEQNFNMVPATNVLTEVVIKWKKPLIRKEGKGMTFDAQDIKQLATTEVSDVASLTPGIFQQKRGAGVSIAGARKTGTLYIIDGVQVQNIGDDANTGINMSQNAIEQMEVITSGIPAKYGDVSGGVVSITSRGVARKTTGSLRVQQSIDGYNNRLINFSVAGPLYKKRVDSVTKKPVLGFALSGDWYDDHNRYPTYDRQYVVKDSKLKELEASPLTIVSDNSGAKIYNYSSNYITFDDMEQKKIQPRNRTQEARLNGKVDYQLTDNLRVIGGGMVDYVIDDEYSRRASLMAPDATFSRKDLTSRGFIRFTQKFGKMNDTSARNNIISNAFYSVQADFQRTSTWREDPEFKKDIFKYAYVGKFIQRPRQNIYGFNQEDSLSGKSAIILQGSTPTGIDFERSETNPVIANYTSQYYGALGGIAPLSMQAIQANNGMVNGDMPRTTYSYNGVGLFNTPGVKPNYYYYFISDQYALDVNASFDLQAGKTKHAIEFGLYYQQRSIKSYTAYANFGGGTQSLWSQMRNLVSTVDNNNLRLDKQHPIFRIGGKEYEWISTGVVGQGSFIDRATGKPANVIPGPLDTVYYNLKNVGTSAFDNNLRNKLGVGRDAVINVDELDPSTFSLDLFSADELLNISGNSFVDYYGYTYTGGKQTGAVNFNDFWTQKDSKGQYTRPIGAFSPTYIAGYLQDRFNYKDINFNIGFRVDRYSANTKVLKDPYSLYPVTTVGQVSGATNFANGGAHPSNIGSNYVVYVNDNNSSNPAIIGYRNGNSWYDPTGKLIEDPALLKNFSDGRDPQPYIQSQYKNVSMTDSNFNPNLSFTDYAPQVTVMPRIQFSFPISDVANFYAHYDIYAQRPYPNSIGYATAWDYYKLSAAAPTTVLANSNLRSQKTFDYEVGFQQKLTDNSALTLSAFYKERKDMVSIVSYVYAFPYQYQTYGNRDFSTTKGTTLLYDMRATNHLRMTVSYTLQFAEGTGSSYNGGRGLLNTLVNEGLPNLRYVTALDVDSRHIIAANADFRYNQGEGPMVGKKHILENAGANLIMRTRSGEPYTRYTDALAQTVVGGVNGARLPWHFGMDLRIDKDFALKFGKKGTETAEGKKPKRVNYIKGILMINNLLNTREVLGVHGFTGRTDDNGYLVSSFGQQFVPQQINPRSYTDLYTIYMNDPNNLNYARTISLALEFNF